MARGIDRGIAPGELTSGVVTRVLSTEIWLGLTTSAVTGLVIAGVAYLCKGPFLAAVVGTLVPIALKMFRVDPAIASSVIVTTFTDVFGFFSFLGLATLLIKFPL